MSIYQIAEKKLAKLLGYENIIPHPYPCKEYVWLNDVDGADKRAVPRWTQDDAEAFKLVVEYNLMVDICKGFVEVRYNGIEEDWTVQDSTEHNNEKFLAARYAIVLAVIAKLEGETK